MAKMVGSPLNLVELESNDTNGVFSNYNNRTRKNGKGSVSLFSGDRIIRPFGVGLNGDTPGSNNDFDSKKNKLHSDDLYDISINNIVDKLKGTKAELSFMDFAYLRDVGVYPNNRLMVARRFASPQPDNIMYNSEDGKPLVTLMSWKPVGDDFLSINFGEEWESVSDGSFTGILDEIGSEFKLPGPLGKYLEGGANLIPLPGYAEKLQREFLVKIGILEPGSENQIPEGNPNIIKQAYQRKMVSPAQSGSGLKCTVSIDMECVWEQKYIQGIDPTLAWMDILSMVTRFGTSTSQTFGLSKNLDSNIKYLLQNPDKMIRTAINGIKAGLQKIVNKIKGVMKGMGNSSDEKSEQTDEEKKKEKLDKEKNKLDKSSNKITSLIAKIGDDVIDALVQKYRERIIGITNVLSGMPSTPWHITIGNPLRPIFCSGDMLVQDVQLTLGSNLSFNDLPTTITATFKLTNARSLGLQEIMAKFNSGYLRVLSYKQDDKGRLGNQGGADFSLTQDKGTAINGDKADLEEIKQETFDSGSTIEDLNKRLDDRGLIPEVNPDPNSEEPVVEEPEGPPARRTLSDGQKSMIEQSVTQDTVYTFEDDGTNITATGVHTYAPTGTNKASASHPSDVSFADIFAKKKVLAILKPKALQKAEDKMNSN
jgi:hypothetical protein